MYYFLGKNPVYLRSLPLYLPSQERSRVRRPLRRDAPLRRRELERRQRPGLQLQVLERPKEQNCPPGGAGGAGPGGGRLLCTPAAAASSAGRACVRAADRALRPPRGHAPHGPGRRRVCQRGREGKQPERGHADASSVEDESQILLAS